MGPFDRRMLIGGGAAITAAASGLLAGPRASAAASKSRYGLFADPAPDSGGDQSQRLQKIINQAAEQKLPLILPAGRFKVAGIQLRPGLRLFGAGGLTTLSFGGGPTFITALDGTDIELADLRLDGNQFPLDTALGDGLVSTIGCTRIRLVRLEITGSLGNGISLRRSSGMVVDCAISQCEATAIFSEDARGLEVSHNEITAIGNNGVQVWRTEAGTDGTIVTANRISGVKARSGGTGENGNGVNIFRAGGVLVSGNRISDCAFSAVRSNAGSNCQIIGNSCERLGEVALYAEFGFEGALIANNIVDGAAQGISVTNFNEGGRLGVVQGNIIRNLFTRDTARTAAVSASRRRPIR